jgi:hypothetical protein
MSNTDTLSAIDAMVSTQIGNGAIPTQTTSNMRLDGEGNLTIIGKPVAPAPLDVPANYSAAAEVESLSNQIHALEAELSDGIYDSKGNRTGDRFTGRDREVRETQLTSLRASVLFQMQRGFQLADQKGANEAAAQRAIAEQAAAQAFHGGNPERAELLRKEIDAAEARRVADLIVRGRHA